MNVRRFQAVVVKRFRVHGMNNTCLPSTSGAAANPTLTLAALGFRLLDQLGAGG